MSDRACALFRGRRYLHYYELTPSLKHVYELGMKYVFASAEESASSGSGGGGKGGYVLSYCLFTCSRSAHNWNFSRLWVLESRL